MSTSDDSRAAAAALAAAVAGPAEVSGDAGSVRQYALTELIAADRYLASRDAAAGRRRGLRFNRLVPPGAADVRRPLPAWPYLDWSEPSWQQ